MVRRGRPDPLPILAMLLEFRDGWECFMRGDETYEREDRTYEREDRRKGVGGVGNF